MAAFGDSEVFLPNKHIKYFIRCMQVLPDRYVSLDSSRMTVAFFAISGLDMLDALGTIEKDRKNIINWVYAMQVLPDSTGSNLDQCGFRGSPTVGVSHESQQGSLGCRKYDSGHIAMTYTALLILLILGDDLSGVNRRGVLAGLRRLQLADGSFCPTPDGSENDMRFIYCACCVSYILSDWSGMDVDRANNYIRKSLSYDGAFGQGPGLEAHGGSTFCAVASLMLMGRLHSTLTPRQREHLKRWCIMRQQTGFQGRPNKPADTCYSFWVGATLKLLDAFNFTNAYHNHSFLMETQHKLMGGFAKWPDCNPDVLHAYFGVCGLSLMGEPGVKVMHAALNVSQSAADHLVALHACLNTTLPSTKQCIWATHDAFYAEEYVKFFKRCLSENIPIQWNDDLDLSRLYTYLKSVSTLELLKVSETIDCDMKRTIADSIYLCQMPSNDGECHSCSCGFKNSASNKTSDIGATYCALCSLLVLRDDLARVDTEGIVQMLRRLQSESGCFCQTCGGQEEGDGQTDMELNYWATCVSYIIHNWDGVDRDRLTSYVLQSQTHEGGFGKSSTSEASAEATFHAVATLAFIGNLQTSLTGTSLARLQHWCDQQLQTTTCKSSRKRADTLRDIVWLRSTMQLLGCTASVDVDTSIRVLMESQQKENNSILSSLSPTNLQDITTCQLTVCGAALLCHPELHNIDAMLHLSKDSVQYLHDLHDHKRTCRN
ncbi:hypothetical protein NP493_1477g00021 [Ridgeia piscesae]|uniref:Geranylgeranyl transferase type-1 subunit beta n=1 Tax=Ridgeia piscesae TaxID=27915 RepID=A0AAD9NAL3_RIDPI|nr:hypothetical protein NP493_1477g00021 [Ridgeia piscesae]